MAEQQASQVAVEERPFSSKQPKQVSASPTTGTIQRKIKKEQDILKMDSQKEMGSHAGNRTRG